MNNAEHEFAIMTAPIANDRVAMKCDHVGPPSAAIHAATRSGIELIRHLMLSWAMEESENDVGSLEKLYLYAEEHYLAGKLSLGDHLGKVLHGAKNIINVTLAR
ncbi:hypothetical protein TNCV_4830971 [Trichonephila clavipes]|nr:hypothetical protein TNCV_4830971 [Trichonephila clavipes]